MVHSEEHGDPDLFIVLVDLDVVKSVDDPVDELDSERLVVRRDIDPIPSNEAGILARRVRKGWVAAERPTVPKADEHPQLDDLPRDPEHLCRLFNDGVEGRIVGGIHERDEAFVRRDQPRIDQASAFRLAEPPTYGVAPLLQRGKTLRRRGAQQRFWP
jgi:hypothetical protein